MSVRRGMTPSPMRSWSSSLTPVGVRRTAVSSPASAYTRGGCARGVGSNRAPLSCRRGGGAPSLSVAASRSSSRSNANHRRPTTAMSGDPMSKNCPKARAQREERRRRDAWRGYYHKTGEAPARLSFATQWMGAMRSLLSSRVFLAIRPALLTSVALSSAITAAYESGVLTYTLDPTMHTLLAVPLGLLLVLRTTHAQERFWAARCAWQSLMDACREACRRAVVWCGDDAEGRRAARRISGAALTLVAATEAQAACSLSMPLRQSLAAFAPEELLTRVEAALGTPRSAAEVAAAACLHAIVAAQRSGHLSELHAGQMDSTVGAMAKAAGECECLGRTPTPVEYHDHCTRCVVVFCFSLPFVLAPLHGWPAILTCAMVSYSLMGLEEVASVVEVPFQGYLPLRALWAGLRMDVAAMVPETDNGDASREGEKMGPTCRLLPRNLENPGLSGNGYAYWLP